MNPNKIFLFGLDAAGKTSISKYILNGQELSDPKPTKIFNIDSIILQDLDFRIWDAPGQVNYRKLWGRGLNSANIMIFILDTSNPDRFQEARTELVKVLEDSETRRVPLIFCFHKMDLAGVSENISIANDIFHLENIYERPVFIHKTSIKENSSIQLLKDRLVELVQNARW